MILSGSASQSLAATLADESNEPLGFVEYESFPDGELLATAPEFEGGRAVVVASTVSSDAHLELLQLQDAAREWGAEEVVTVLPYMGYARQDRAFDRGHPISARAVARAISTGTDRVLTVNPHEEAICDFFDVPAESIDAAGRLAEPLPDDLTDPVFLSPDDGALDIAETVRDTYGDGVIDYFEKKRISGSEVEITPSDTDVTGRDVVVTDDIIATGSTMSEAVSLLQERDVGRVFVTCVHPMLARNARTKLAQAGVEAVFGTDTIERAVSQVSVAPTIADAL
ncbi:ribose-phosphate pyrophosphokinase [Haladaptatus paucihalophilus DX253]|uniref:Ribose-phosphate pyrophosphokinase n=1 Tax=Haladaptatus paucihalophilus DX253 TaxID=797209 RepID=E7QNV9_HALPU|nr:MULTISPECIES: ribose-phosphate diphosphokinase [Haladaptatus]EFW93612.1 ribose-phosphate pyrophosphokinase [Haladaptatus paucihalophilus DX253]GKZ14951.1 ribose-phosphate pyrophosphokinase [Haladaptatus sp. T7]SHL45497.1 ribose-phosphate pyrophosphokinase [Haladaptatus paucihalophilus DX253]